MGGSKASAGVSSTTPVCFHNLPNHLPMPCFIYTVYQECLAYNYPTATLVLIAGSTGSAVYVSGCIWRKARVFDRRTKDQQGSTAGLHIVSN